MVSQGALTRAPAAYFVLAFGYFGWGLSLAWLVFAVGSHQVLGLGPVLAPVLFGAVLATVRASSPAPRPPLIKLLLAPLPLTALVLAAAGVHAAFSSEPGPPFALRLATNLFTLAAVLAGYRLYKSGFYSHRWVAR